jgi:hypothetical protein
MVNDQAAPEETDAHSLSPYPRRVNWRQEYLHLAVILMTASWMAPWVALILSNFIDFPLIAALQISVVNLLASMFLVRWLLYRRTSDNRIETVVILLMGIAAAITVLLTPSMAQAYDNGGPLQLADLFHASPKTNVFPAGLLVFFWVLYLWWRGYTLSDGYLTLVRASFGMRLGIVAFLWVLVFADSQLRKDILPLVPIFFFFGLLSSGLARADSLNLDRPGHSTALGRGWMVSLVGIAMIMTLAGFAAALWLTGMDTELAAAVLGIAARILITLLLLLLVPILFLIELAYNFILTLLPDRVINTAADAGAGGARIDHQNAPAWLVTLAQVFSVLLIAILILVILFGIYAMIWFALATRRQREMYHDEERESLGTGEVVGGMRQALRDSWRRLADTIGILRQFGLGRELFTALTIRRIYARMEKLAGLRGYPRTLSETPYEYQRELYQAFPGQNDDIQTITEAYIAVRYGEVPENPAELETVRAAWQRLSQSAVLE